MRKNFEKREHVQASQETSLQSTRTKLFYRRRNKKKLNNILQDKLTSTVEDLLSMIDTQKCQMFHDVKVEEYMRVFDEATTTVSKIPSEEEFQDIQNYWLNITDEKFQEEEENLLDWAAANV